MGSALLIAEHPLQVLPTLAERIGLNEAIVLQQLHYWTTRAKDPEGWIYNTIKEWQRQFPFWSAETIKRTWKSLRDQGLVETRQTRGTDRTKSYRVVYSKVPEADLPKGQIDSMKRSNRPDEEVKLTPCLEPSETTQRTVPGSKLDPEEWKDWLEDYIAVTGRTATRNGSAEAHRLFAGRRAEGRSVAELKLATRGAHSDPHIREQGFDRPETILRPGKITRYIELGGKVQKAARRKPGESANEKRKRIRREQGLED
jgi:hypothetical protein